jgi:hypothetical protein
LKKGTRIANAGFIGEGKEKEKEKEKKIPSY